MYAPKDVVICSFVAAGTLLPSLRRIVSKADPQLPVSDVKSLTDIVEAETRPRTVQVRILGPFAAVSFLLAGIGIHGLLAFAVSHRTREIGVRIALGARRRDILEMVLRKSAILAAAGIAAGVALAWVGARLMEALLAGVSAHDAPTFAAAVVLALLMTLRKHGSGAAGPAGGSDPGYPRGVEGRSGWESEVGSAPCASASRRGR